MSRGARDAGFDALFRRYRRDAVLLHRPYPPHSGGRTNSKFGGLPRLPGHYEWPRTSDGRPLHFFAQIDCADIGFPTALPERGVLFFFGRDDEAQIWNHEGTPADDCRVVYALDAFAATPLREAPAELPPIGGYYPAKAWREYLREGERGPNLHVEWPIQPLAIESWPDVLPEQPEQQLPEWRAFLDRLLRPQPAETWQEAEARSRRYEERLEELREEAYAEATGERSARDPASSNQDGAAARTVFFHAENGGEAYPQHWITIHYAARALLHRPARALVTDAAGEAGLVAAAEDWLRRADEAGLDEAVEEADRAAFRTWLKSLRPPKDDTPLAYGAADLVFASLTATVRAWAGDRERAARLSPHVYAALHFHFNGFTVWGLQFSQMLGHTPSAQEPLPPDDPTVCLLNLASDQGLGWMFGDVGNCSFWIAPDDLARRNFERGWGTIEGH